MNEFRNRILDLICLVAGPPRAGGAIGLVEEVLLLRKQLDVLTRGKKKGLP